MTGAPRIRKAQRVTGHRLVLRDARADDAAFIVALRADTRHNRFLAAPTIEQQTAWLTAYARADDQAYFIVCDSALRPLGTVRLYDALGDSFSWGSWLIEGRAPASVAVESALIVYAYALHHLGFNASHFEVRRANKSVWRFHERFGAVREREDERDIYYRIGKEVIAASMRRLARFLPRPIKVVE